MEQIDLIVIGGGAAGIFAALQTKKCYPEARVVVLEKTNVLLSKVRVSGGGRCNVTHSCFEPKSLSTNYPRGNRELIGPFHRFQPIDTIAWFESRGVPLKTEEDGRIFPVTDSSETIIACLLDEAKRLGIEIRTRQRVEGVAKGGDFVVRLKEGVEIGCRRLILATGSSAEGHEIAKSLGHTIEEPVPSLFTFNIPSFPLEECSGIAVDAGLKIAGTNLSQQGRLLITHFGFSGPATLKLSAWAARELFEKKYQFELIVNWLPSLSWEQILNQLKENKRLTPQKLLGQEFALPKNLWKTLVPEVKKYNDWSLKELQILAEKLSSDRYLVSGKTTHKEEFVTCGGVKLSEIAWKTLESKICPGLFFAGEILDVDGVTGGFNFQNAWTSAFHAGSSAFLKK